MRRSWLLAFLLFFPTGMQEQGRKRFDLLAYLVFAEALGFLILPCAHCTVPLVSSVFVCLFTNLSVRVADRTVGCGHAEQWTRFERDVRSRRHDARVRCGRRRRWPKRQFRCARLERDRLRT